MKDVAKESRFVSAARDKLEVILKNEHARFNPNAMKRIAATIKASIARHHPEKKLKDREITLFDENRHTAQVKNSQVLALSTLLHKNQKGLTSSKKTASRLRPRRK